MPSISYSNYRFAREILNNFLRKRSGTMSPATTLRAPPYCKGKAGESDLPRIAKNAYVSDCLVDNPK
jgi:hypothetical protein